jgi:hypothetical protein
MKNDRRDAYVSRDMILRLLSDGEVTRVSMAETHASLPVGDEYLDLEKPQQGVQLAGAAKLFMNQVVPRSAVSAGTWRKILAHLGVRAPHPAL